MSITPGPELVIAGAARSGTSYLAAQLSMHPAIDPGSVKEPNYFSRNHDRGADWYDGLFAPRTVGVLRMDASVSYTFPRFPEALDRLADECQVRLVVYVVRDPVPRAISHYLYHRYYFKQEDAADFGTALRENPLYAGASDYGRWIAALQERFGIERMLVVPFQSVTGGHVDEQVCSLLGLTPPAPEEEQGAEAHRNNVVTFKHGAFRVASRTLRRSRLYPLVRERLGADRLRRVRSLVTRETVLPTREQALASCSPEQRVELDELGRQARAAASQWLAEQDERLGLSWLPGWEATAPGTRRAGDQAS